MSASARGPAEEYSRGSRESRGAAKQAALTPWVALICALAGAAALVVTEFTTVIEIHAGAATVKRLSGIDRHGYALFPIAAIALAMALGATRRASRPAAIALTLLGLIALAIALLGDLPDIHKTGVYGARFEDATAESGIGFFIETAGALLLTIAGTSMLLLRPEGTRNARPERPGPKPE